MAFSKLTEWMTPKKKHIYDFHEGCVEDRHLLGYKGSMLCEMSRIKIPVPYGFIITTDYSIEYFKNNTLPFTTTNKSPVNSDSSTTTNQSNFSKLFKDELIKNIQQLENKTKKEFGTSNSNNNNNESPGEDVIKVVSPLLLSIRVSSSVHIQGSVCKLYIYSYLTWLIALMCIYI